MIRKKPKQTESEFEKRVAGAKLLEIEVALEKKVISQIRKRQKEIPGLKLDNFDYTAVWGNGDLTPGCKRCCLKGRWTQIRTTTKCNLNCSFCYYFGEKETTEQEFIPHDLYLVSRRLFNEKDMELLFETHAKKFLNGVAWLHFEPLMDMDKMLPLMKFIHNLGYHQWLYTNGLLANKENLKKLKDAGLDEIRFNLAATNCSEEVIKNMSQARKYFKYLCIESPMFTLFYESFMKKKKAILDTGVDHIHFAELQLFPKTKDNFSKEGTIYRYKLGYVSPIKSRQLTYNIFEVAAKEGWKNVVLHDCSNETKFLRGIISGEKRGFADIDYDCALNPDEEFYKQALLYL
ncbi:MAG: radical SAM protein [Candidatus Omnitrophota bacterium]